MMRRTCWKLALCAILTGILAIGAFAEPALTDEGSRSVDEQAVAAALAAELYARAAANEPAVTADMRSMETEYAHLVGLEFRLKTRESLARKILLEAHTLEITPEAAAAAISDALRYTFCIDESRYVETTDTILRQLDAKGYKVEKVKNTWGNLRRKADGGGETGGSVWTGARAGRRAGICLEPGLRAGRQSHGTYKVLSF